MDLQKRMRFPLEIILTCIRWYAAYSLSYRNLEEMMAERGVTVDHSTINRWAIRFLPLLEKRLRRHLQHGNPTKITMDKSGANKAALDQINAERDTPIKLRQNKYLNNVVEQDHRFIKRITKPMMGFKSVRSARATLAGIELVYMLKKGQMTDLLGNGLSAANQFYALAA